MIFINLLRISRPKQWVKQILILLPCIAFGAEIQFHNIEFALIAVLNFTMVSISVYVFNDLADREQDRLDITKSHRPLASGALEVRTAKQFAFFMLFIGFSVIFVYPENKIAIFLLLQFYLLINFLYTRFRLKRFNLPGIVIVALGFPIRFAIGILAMQLPFSFWATTLIMELALVMLAGKRYQTLQRVKLQDETFTHKVLRVEDANFWLLTLVTFCASFTSTYASFISNSQIQSQWGNSFLLLTPIPLVLGLVRYLEIVTHPKKFLESDATETVIKDVPSILFVSLFIILMFASKASA
jgi:4-hydroxybenzoate polyprenyltransferase